MSIPFAEYIPQFGGIVIGYGSLSYCYKALFPAKPEKRNLTFPKIIGLILTGGYFALIGVVVPSDVFFKYLMTMGGIAGATSGFKSGLKTGEKISDKVIKPKVESTNPKPTTSSDPKPAVSSDPNSIVNSDLWKNHKEK